VCEEGLFLLNGTIYLMGRFTLVPFEVSSRDLQLVGSVVIFSKQQSKRNLYGTQDLQILRAVETRILRWTPSVGQKIVRS
jgi:hypothetical protein